MFFFRQLTATMDALEKPYSVNLRGLYNQYNYIYIGVVDIVGELNNLDLIPTSLDSIDTITDALFLKLQNKKKIYQVSISTQL